MVSDDYGNDYIQSDGSSVDSGATEGGTYGDWSEGNYDYTYGNVYDYGNDYWNNLNNGVSSYGNLDTGVGSGFNSANWGVNPDTSSWGNIGGSVTGVLQDLFTKGTTANTIGQVGAALLSGYQNKQKAKALSKAASQIDPWASQRSYYQTQAKNTVTDPYNQPIVAAQIAQLQNAQNAKDAAAGRRSNSLLGSTAVMAEAAKIAQAYQAQMAAQGGANIQPSGLSSMLTQATNANTDGYISPLADLFGTTSQSNENTNSNRDISNKLSALLKFVQGGYQ